MINRSSLHEPSCLFLATPYTHLTSLRGHSYTHQRKKGRVRQEPLPACHHRAQGVLAVPAICAHIYTHLSVHIYISYISMHIWSCMYIWKQNLSPCWVVLLQPPSLWTGQAAALRLGVFIWATSTVVATRTCAYMCRLRVDMDVDKDTDGDKHAEPKTNIDTDTDTDRGRDKDRKIVVDIDIESCRCRCRSRKAYMHTYMHICMYINIYL